MFFPNLRTHKKSQEHSNIVPQRRGEAKKQEMCVFTETSPGGPRAVLTGALSSSGANEKVLKQIICPQASLKNMLFSVGPSVLFDHGQILMAAGLPIYCC